jgi:predicted transcriptional regulator of viral defense system
MGRLTDALAVLAGRGIEFFSVEDLQRELGIEPVAARELASGLAQNGLVRRIRRDLYATVPPADWRRPDTLPANWFRTAAEIVAPAPYFLAYYTAMEIHGITQHPLRTVFVAVMRQRKPVVTAGVSFRFITLKPARFFGYEEAEVEQGFGVDAADLERTLIDCVDRPDLCGGLEEVVRGFMRRHNDLDADRLLRYLLRLDQQFLVKRLGFLLEVLGHRDVELLANLEKLARGTKRYVLLDKSGRDQGERNRRWGLTINVDLPKLLNATRS